MSLRIMIRNRNWKFDENLRPNSCEQRLQLLNAFYRRFVRRTTVFVNPLRYKKYSLGKMHPVEEFSVLEL